jgi:hypothetical protein
MNKASIVSIGDEIISGQIDAGCSGIPRGAGNPAISMAGLTG